MRLLYIAVHEQNKDWGAEHFLAKAFLSLGVDLVTIDYRKHRKDIIQRTTVQRNYPIGSVDLNRNHSSDVLV